MIKRLLADEQREARQKKNTEKLKYQSKKDLTDEVVLNWMRGKMEKELGIKN